MIIQQKSFEKARNEIKKFQKEFPDKETIFSSQDDELNRKILEKETIQVLLINQKNKKDFQKQRNSGLNHVLSEIAKKSNIKIGINLDEIIESSSKEKSEIIARTKQNIMLCNKKKLQMKFIFQKEQNQRNISDLKSLGLILRMPTWMTKNL